MTPDNQTKQWIDDDRLARVTIKPNLWRIVSVHGQPPANTLIDFVWGNGTSTTMGRLTGAEPAYSEHIKWRLSDLPPLDAVAPPPAPERPEPKFKIGDRVQWAPGTTCAGEFAGIVGEVKWMETLYPYWRCYSHPRSGEGSWGAPESMFTAAPEPSIPIGGWFDPGDGRTLQRIAVPVPGYGDLKVWCLNDEGAAVSTDPRRCSPLTEREAMERIYPVGTWLRDDFGATSQVMEWRDGTEIRAVQARLQFVERDEPWLGAAYVKHCTVLPGPPLPAPWRPLDELPEDGKRRVMAVRTDGLRETVSSSYVRRFPLAFAAWADLDDVAPIPAHLRSTP